MFPLSMPDIDPRAFLALMGLARRCTEETLSCARAAFPGVGDEDLKNFAKEAEEYCHRQLLTVSVKVPPTRKVSCWSEDSAILECGHVVRVRVGQMARTARCRRCLTEENRAIVENLSGKTELQPSGT